MRNAVALAVAVALVVVAGAIAPAVVAGAPVQASDGSALSSAADGSEVSGAVVATNASTASTTVASASTTSATPSTTLELQEAFQGRTDRDTLSYTFTADANTTVTAETEASDGEVTFTYDRWSSGASGGSSSSFEVVDGESYTVYYDVVGESRGEDGFDTTRSVDMRIGSMATASLSATVDYVSPSFGTSDADDARVTFEGESQQSVSVTVTIRNDGRGDMNVQGTATSSDTDVTASTENVPSTVDAGRSATFTVDVTVDESANEGQKDVAVAIEDNLGNREVVRFDVSVRKATRVVATQNQYNVGDVLRGDDATMPVEIVEQTGYDDVDVEIVEAIGAGPNASLSVSGLDGRIPAGGSESGTLGVSVNGRSPQHETFSWTVRVRPTDDQDASPTTFRVTARTIYPAEFGKTTASSPSYTFDEERGNSEYTQRVDTTIENTGDLPLDLTAISVSSPDVDDSLVSVDVAQGSERVPGLSDRDYELDVTVDSRAPEGTHTLVIEYQSANASAGTETIRTDMRIDHETRVRLDESALSFGRLEITRSDTRTVSVREVLGYNDVGNLTLERVDGPDEGWLTIERGVPGTLSARESTDVVFGLQFDTDAEVLTEYEWTFEVNGDDIEPQTVTITAEPGLIDAQETKDSLSTYADGSGSVASGATTMTELLSRLESKIESGDLDSGADISRAFTAAQTYVTLVNATEQTRAHLEAGENEAAQRDLVRAASTYNTVSLYVSQLEDGELAGLGEDGLSDGSDALNELIETQRAYYEQRLGSEDTSLLEEAIVKRELARIAVLQGDDDRANTLETAADRAFQAYSQNVSAGQERLQAARGTNENLTASSLTVVGGQPLLLNPAALGTFQSQTASVLDNYDTARERFQAAGATETAADVRQERSQIASEYRTAETALYVASAGYLVAFVAVIVHLFRGTTAYVSDAEETATGDFLV
jgi:hypothetical protein